MQPFGIWAIACKSMFLSYCKKRRHQYFLCRIVRMRATSIAMTTMMVFFVVLQWASNNNTTFSSYHKQASNDHVVLQRASQRTLYREGKQEQLCFLHHIARETMTRSIFYMLYRKKRWRRAFFYIISQKGDDAIVCKSMFSSQGCKQLAVIVIHDCRFGEGWQWSYFLHCIATSEQRRLYFLDRSRGSEQTSSVKINGINQRMIIPLYL